jgi:hypothetical protein
LRQKGFSVTLAPHLEGDDNFQRSICNRTDGTLLWLTLFHMVGTTSPFDWLPLDTHYTRPTGTADFGGASGEG